MVKPDTIYRRRYRAKLRAQGLCIDCGKPKYRTLLRCAGCAAKDNERQLRYYYRKRDKRLEYYANRRKKRRDNDQCPNCGVKLDPDADQGMTYCINCRERNYSEVL